MLYMNAYEVDASVARYCEHPILGPATETLANLMDAANANSDGWAYWPKPVRAAAKLMKLIGGFREYVNDPERPDITVAQLRAAYVPLKAFRTRSGLPFEIVEAIGVS